MTTSVNNTVIFPVIIYLKVNINPGSHLQESLPMCSLKGALLMHFNIS